MVYNCPTTDDITVVDAKIARRERAEFFSHNGEAFRPQREDKVCNDPPVSPALHGALNRIATLRGKTRKMTKGLLDACRVEQDDIVSEYMMD